MADANSGLKDRDKDAYVFFDGKWHRRVVVSTGGSDVDQTCRIDDTTTADTIYIGKADTGTATSAASWRIKRVQETGGEVITQYADGNSNFDNVWDNRASLSYS